MFSLLHRFFRFFYWIIFDNIIFNFYCICDCEHILFYILFLEISFSFLDKLCHVHSLCHSFSFSKTISSSPFHFSHFPRESRGGRCAWKNGCPGYGTEGALPPLSWIRHQKASHFRAVGENVDASGLFVACGLQISYSRIFRERWVSPAVVPLTAPVFSLPAWICGPFPSSQQECASASPCQLHWLLEAC